MRQVLDYAASSDLSALKKGQSQATTIATPKGVVKGALINVDDQTYQLLVPVKKAALVATWLRDLSDGYTSFKLDGEKDFSAKRMPGPFAVEQVKKAKVKKRLARRREKPSARTNLILSGSAPRSRRNRCRPSNGTNTEEPVKLTALHDTHKSMGARMVPFAGWEMPVRYTSVVEEHLATRQAAGLFDVSHMGVYDVRGADAASFLDTICGNDCGGLLPGESLYSQFLTPDADVIDDTLVYRRGWDKLSRGGQRLER